MKNFLDKHVDERCRESPILDLNVDINDNFRRLYTKLHFIKRKKIRLKSPSFPFFYIVKR